MNDLVLCPKCRHQNLVNARRALKCIRCSSIYPIKEGILILIKPENQADILSQWDKKDEFETIHKRRLRYNRESFATTPRVIDTLRENTYNNSLSLDVGCGSGLYTKHFKGKVLSFDIVPYFIKELSKNNKNKDHLYVIADAKDFPFKKNRFDLVFCSQVVEHLDEVSSEKLIKRIIATSNKIAVIDTPNEGSTLLQVFKKIIYKNKKHDKGNYHLDHHRKISVEDLSKFGMDVHGCVGFVTRRSVRAKIIWDLYDAIAWRLPSIGGNLIGISKKN